MTYSKGDFLIKLFTHFKCKDDADRLEDYARLLGNSTIWDYEKCYNLILNEYRALELPTIALIKEFRKKCRFDYAMKEKKYTTVTLRKKIYDRNGKIAKTATYQFAVPEGEENDFKDLIKKGYERVQDKTIRGEIKKNDSKIKF